MFGIFNHNFCLKEEQKKAADCQIADKCSDLGAIPRINLSTKRSLKGHINKVNSVHYTDDSRFLIYQMFLCEINENI